MVEGPRTLGELGAQAASFPSEQAIALGCGWLRWSILPFYLGHTPVLRQDVIFDYVLAHPCFSVLGEGRSQ